MVVINVSMTSNYTTIVISHVYKHYVMLHYTRIYDTTWSKE